MRSCLIAVLLGVPVAAQTPDASRTFPKGAVSSRLTLNLPAAPEVGDNIDISCSTSELRVTLIAPDGQRITSETASTERLRWFESPSREPDWGRSVIITFRSPGESGAYAVEVSGQTKRKSAVSVFLSFPSKAHGMVIEKAFPGAIVAPAVRAPATITLNVKEHEEASLIDVLTPEPGTRIALTLPDGRTVTPESIRSHGFDGITMEAATTTQAEKVARLLFPQSGNHNVFYFERAPQGAYRISATQAGEPAEFRALFVPYEKGWDNYLAEFASRRFDLRNVHKVKP